MRIGTLLKRGKNTAHQFQKKSTELLAWAPPWVTDWLLRVLITQPISHGATPHANALKKILTSTKNIENTLIN